MNAFYAAGKQLDHPELRGKPVIVASRGYRGIRSSCDPEDLYPGLSGFGKGLQRHSSDRGQQRQF
ncbi:MAG: hypothetical protein NZ651_06370 [Candidatus Bipolaricaulota bacterium]|nr:hypothetical protein [Candidatus Bipolaricaulota bacterium]MDW8127379.1 hypothetical protein [Candidatus Bipolaricaulota bacterium]